MRHGIRDNIKPGHLNHPEGFKAINGSNLGCYFCNDVTAPGDVSFYTLKTLIIYILICSLLVDAL